MFTKVLSSFKLSSLISKISKNKNLLIIGLLIITTLLLVLYYVRDYIYRIKELDTKEAMTGSSNNEAEIIFFFADWCPHCTKAKPVVNELKSKYNGRTINNKNVSFKDVDCSVETQDMKRDMEKYDVESFPTIAIQIGDEVTKFEDKVEAETLSQFIQKTIV
jgi:thiol-disulfide isomerase/thioredoxin